MKVLAIDASTTVASVALASENEIIAEYYLIMEGNMKKYRCTICGYEIETDTLPEDFVCPICGQPVSAFEKID